MAVLDDSYWSERYTANKTGWDLGTIAPPLKTYFDQLELELKTVDVLIPGCGNAHEAAYLLLNNFSNINIIDISEVLVDAIKIEFSKNIENRTLNVIHGDFFEHQGKYDLIIEQTFFCAITPSLRADYAKKMSELLHPNGKLVGVMFNCEFEGGPPFGGSAEEYRTYFEPYFDFKTFDACYNSIAPRSGSELFVNLQLKKLNSI